MISRIMQDFKIKTPELFSAWPKYNKTHDLITADKMLDFAAKYPDNLNRQTPGHFTASALVLNPDKTKLVLTLHKKLNIWIQLGGHADGNPKLQEVAFKEAYEESGLQEIKPLLDFPFNLDIHEIPPYKTEAGHLHLDSCYLFQATDETLKISSESKDLAWVSIKEGYNLAGNDASVSRILDKLTYLQTIL